MGTPTTSPNRRAELAARREATERARRRNRLFTYLAAGLLLALVIVVGVHLATKPASTTAPTAPVGARAIRPESHRLSTAPDGKVTLVEFSDFECPSCRAVNPLIDELRKEYAGRVTFAVRHLPLEGHPNSWPAAKAAEAAGNQGKFEEMFKQLHATQQQWAGRPEPQDALFRTYAAQLGLDMAKYDTDYASPATTARIQTDIDDAGALGVKGTPAFVLNGRLIEPKDQRDMRGALDRELAR